MHGKQSAIRHDGRGLFAGLPNPLKVGRYHSLVVEDMADAPFTITARGDDNEIMALRYKDRPWAGVQFHPESVLTPDGLRLLGNFPESLMAATKTISACPRLWRPWRAGKTWTRRPLPAPLTPSLTANLPTPRPPLS
jgi:anthranilate synthase/phosphoribosyltransferase